MKSLLRCAKQSLLLLGKYSLLILLIQPAYSQLTEFYVETAVSGAPILGIPSLEGRLVTTRHTETSNNVIEELGNLSKASLKEMNSKVISSVDQMLG